jgi:hypothetical protein
VVVPPAVVLEVGQAGVAAVGSVLDVVGFTGRGGLVAAAGELACLVPQGDQAPQMDGDVVGLALVRIFVPMRAVGPHAVAAGLLRLVRAGAQDPASDLAELGWRRGGGRRAGQGLAGPEVCTDGGVTAAVAPHANTPNTHPTCQSDPISGNPAQTHAAAITKCGPEVSHISRSGVLCRILTESGRPIPYRGEGSRRHPGRPPTTEEI